MQRKSNVNNPLCEGYPSNGKGLPTAGEALEPRLDDKAGLRQSAATSPTTDRNPPGQPPKLPAQLKVGSDVEIARHIAEGLRRDYCRVPYCDGEFWAYSRTHWEPVPAEKLRHLVHTYDGIPWGSNWKRTQLNKGRINSILNELGAMLSERDFFDARPIGINCLSGFIAFDDDGPRLLPHAPEHRQRHVLQARWEPGGSGELPETSLFSRLLRGSLEGDDDADKKIDLIAEIAGAAALGHGPRHTSPKAVVLLGRTAENGKSQILDVLRGLLPAGAVSSVPPSRFGDDRHIVKLVGKLLNTSDEWGPRRRSHRTGSRQSLPESPSRGATYTSRRSTSAPKPNTFSPVTNSRHSTEEWTGGLSWTPKMRQLAKVEPCP
jgi:hypothetical protein